MSAEGSGILRTSKALAVVILAATSMFVRPLLAGDPESLLAAAAAGNVDLVRTVLDRDAPPNTCDQAGNTARLYGLRPKLAQHELTIDKIAAIKAEYNAAGGQRTNARYGYVARSRA